MIFSDLLVDRLNELKVPDSKLTRAMLRAMLNNNQIILMVRDFPDGGIEISTIEPPDEPTTIHGTTTPANTE